MSRRVKVRLSLGKDLNVALTDAMTTRELKQIILEQTEATRRLRIIYLGKILQDSQIIAQVAPFDAKEIVVQCSVSEDGPKAGPPDTARPPEANLGDSETTPAPRGFDRLRAAGLSEEDIANLRNQFNHEGADEQAALIAEEAWIDNEGQDGNDALQGLSYDILLGTCGGFFLGFVALLILTEHQRLGFSKRVSTAVVVGVLFNVVFGLCR